MSNTQKEKIIALRQQGKSCANIAENLGISVNTVKSFCRRNNIAAKTEDDAKATAETIGETAMCPQCGNTITQISGRKPKRFCTDGCRVQWWNSHSENVRQKALYSFKCGFCGQDFTAYGNAKRRYCSHSCYCKARFGRPADRKAAAV